MEITNEQRDQAYNAASEQQLFLYEEPESGTRLFQLAEQYALIEPRTYANFAVAVGDVILGLVPQEKLPDLLVERLQIDKTLAMKITADVLDFLAPLSRPNTTTPAATPIAITTSVPVTTTPSPSMNAQSLAAEIAAAEQALQSVQPMRTMAKDMNVARSGEAQPPATHNSTSQDTLLSGNQAKNTDAQWNTAQQ